MGIKERKKREREMRRQQIMIAAKRIFTQKGYEKSTMEDIAREAELSPGTLYLYFKSKDELYASLCLRVLRFITVKVDLMTVLVEALSRFIGQLIQEVKFASDTYFLA